MKQILLYFFLTVICISVFCLKNTGAKIKPEISPEIFLQLGHSGQVDNICYSPNGKYLLSGSEDNTIKLWDVKSGKVLRTFSCVFYHLKTPMDYSPDGRYIVTANFNDTVMWDIVTGGILKTFSGHKDEIISICINPNANFLATADEYVIKIWEVNTGKFIHTLDEGILSMDFSPDGEKLITGLFDNKSIKLFELNSGKLLREFSVNSKEIFSVIITPDEKRFISGGHDNGITLWDMISGQYIRTFDGSDKHLYSVRLSPDGNQLVSGNLSSPVLLWDINSGQRINTFQDYGLGPCFSPDGGQIAYGVMDEERTSSIKICNSQNSKEIKTLYGRKINSYPFCLCPNGLYLAIADTNNNLVKLVEISSGKVVKVFKGHSKSISFINFSSDSQYIIFGDSAIMTLWNSNSGIHVCTFISTTSHPFTFNALYCNPDKKQIIIANYNTTNNSIMLLDVYAGIKVTKLQGHSHYVQDVNFSNDGQLIVSGSNDNSLKLWNVNTGKLLKTFIGHKASVNSVCFSPDNHSIVSGSDDKTVKLWNVNTGKLIKTYSGSKKGVNFVSFTPDGKYIVNGTYDHMIRIWDVTSGQLVKRYENHSKIIRSMAFNQDGHHIVSLDTDDTIHLWDKHTGQTKIFFTLLPNCEWLATKPGSLYYNSSPNGDQYAAIRFNNNTFNWKPLSHYRSRYKTDNLYAFESKSECKKIELPIIKILSPSNNHITQEKVITLEFKKNGVTSPIRHIKFYVNNQLENPLKHPPDIDFLSKRVDNTEKYLIYLPEEQNDIRVVITNEDNLTSFDAIRVFRKKENQPPKGKLYLISVGVNTLDHIKGNNLDYAANDANDIVSIMKSMKCKLYSDVITHVYTDYSINKPYSDILENALYDHTKSATANDTVMIFLAGHGVSIDKNKYVLLTRDAEKTGKNDYKISSVLKWADIIDAIKDLKCTILMIIDTCYTGGIDIQELIPKGNYENNIIIFTSTSKNQKASECEKYTNGCFTYAIKKGLGKTLPADLNNDKKVTITEIKDYTVSELEDKLLFKQTPTLIIPKAEGSNFIFYVEP